MKKYFKTTGRFEVSDSRGNIIDGRFFLNKICEADCPRSAMQKAIAYMKSRASRKYGKRAVISQISDVIVNTHPNGPKKRKTERVKGQLALPFGK